MSYSLARSCLKPVHESGFQPWPTRPMACTATQQEAGGEDRRDTDKYCGTGAGSVREQQAAGARTCAEESRAGGREQGVEVGTEDTGLVREGFEELVHVARANLIRHHNRRAIDLPDLSVRLRRGEHIGHDLPLRRAEQLPSRVIEHALGVGVGGGEVGGLIGADVGPKGGSRSAEDGKEVERKVGLLEAEGAVRGARLDARVLQQEGGDIAPLDHNGEVGVDLALCGARATAEWQPLEVCLGRTVGPLEEVALISGACGAGFGAVAVARRLMVIGAHAVAVRVVGELVVIPLRDHGDGRAELQEPGVFNVQCVTAAVIGQGHNLPWRLDLLVGTEAVAAILICAKAIRTAQGCGLVKVLFRHRTHQGHHHQGCCRWAGCGNHRCSRRCGPRDRAREHGIRQGAHPAGRRCSLAVADGRRLAGRREAVHIVHASLEAIDVELGDPIVAGLRPHCAGQGGRRREGGRIVTLSHHECDGNILGWLSGREAGPDNQGVVGRRARCNAVVEALFAAKLGRQLRAGNVAREEGLVLDHGQGEPRAQLLESTDKLRIGR
eukprot:scaffold4499_cov122-Isochrysis_galbana.AAC.5